MTLSNSNLEKKIFLDQPYSLNRQFTLDIDHLLLFDENYFTLLVHKVRVGLFLKYKSQRKYDSYKPDFVSKLKPITVFGKFYDEDNAAGIFMA